MVMSTEQAWAELEKKYEMEAQVKHVKAQKMAINKSMYGPTISDIRGNFTNSEDYNEQLKKEKLRKTSSSIRELTEELEESKKIQREIINGTSAKHVKPTEIVNSEVLSNTLSEDPASRLLWKDANEELKAKMSLLAAVIETVMNAKNYFSVVPLYELEKVGIKVNTGCEAWDNLHKLHVVYWKDISDETMNNIPIWLKEVIKV